MLKPKKQKIIIERMFNVSLVVDISGMILNTNCSLNKYKKKMKKIVQITQNQVIIILLF